MCANSKAKAMSNGLSTYERKKSGLNCWKHGISFLLLIERVFPIPVSYRQRIREIGSPPLLNSLRSQLFFLAVCYSVDISIVNLL